GKSDVWVEISTADLICLTSTRPNRVAQAYKKALTDAPDQARDAARRQLALYQRLGILKENIQAGLDSIAPVALPEPQGGGEHSGKGRWDADRPLGRRFGRRYSFS